MKNSNLCGRIIVQGHKIKAVVNFCLIPVLSMTKTPHPLNGMDNSRKKILMDNASRLYKESIENASTNEISPVNVGFESMTQDCIEWDESKNLDLRDLTSIDSMRDGCASQTNQGLKTMQYTKKKCTAPLHSKSAHISTELEIESIFNKLSGTGSGSSVSEAFIDTPLKGNKSDKQGTNRSQPSSNEDDASLTLSVGSRKRLRRTFSDPGNPAMTTNAQPKDDRTIKNRLHRSRFYRGKFNENTTDIGNNSSLSSNSPMVQPTSSSDFDDLVDQVKTPSPSDISQKGPPKSKEGQSYLSKVSDTINVSPSLCTHEMNLNTTSPQKSADLEPDTTARNLRRTEQLSFLEINKENIRNESDRNESLSPGKLSSELERSKKNSKNSSSSQRLAGDQFTTVQKNNILMERNTNAEIRSYPDSNHTFFSQDSFPELALDIDPGDNKSHEQNSIVQPQPTKQENDSLVGNMTKDDDEFDDLELSVVDLETFDSWNAAVSQGNSVIAISENNNERADQLSLVNKFNSEALSHNGNQVTTSTEFEDDEFGDFPEFDFDVSNKSNEAVECKSELASLSLCRTSTQSATFNPPHLHEPVKNPRTNNASVDLSFLAYSRYKVIHVDDNVATFTKSLHVTPWIVGMLHGEKNKSLRIHKSDSIDHIEEQAQDPLTITVIHLRGEWYHTRVYDGDYLNLCSLSGQFRTDVEALPVILHTSPPSGSVVDDLVLVMHPDLLLTPTLISETVSCTRRAILKSLVGSSGLSSKAALFGTMKHQLFEATMKSKEFRIASTRKYIKEIVRHNADGLLSCAATSDEAEKELRLFVPQLSKFADQYTTFGSPLVRKDQRNALLENQNRDGLATQFRATSVEVVEEPLISPELGLKGNIDMIVTATMGPSSSVSASSQTESLIGIELKTGHNQKTQNAHMAQLALYILMMQTRYGSKGMESFAEPGATKSGVLLYMNDTSLRAVHISPLLSELKSLIGQRNVVAIEQIRSSQPRGIQLVYENETSERFVRHIIIDPPPPAALPDVLPNAFSCTKCYSNRECMLFAATSISSNRHFPGRMDNIETSHGKLLHQFTGHLSVMDFDYFAKWDRLIGLETDATNFRIADSWLIDAVERETTTSRSISSLVVDLNMSKNASTIESNRAVIVLSRSQCSVSKSPLNNLGIECGSRVVISTDSTTTGDIYDNGQRTLKKAEIGKMHLVRGAVEALSENYLHVVASADDLARIVKYASSINNREMVKFRVDKDDASTINGSLRQNLINLLTDDVQEPSSCDVTMTTKRTRLRKLRDILVHNRPPEFDEEIQKIMFHPSSSSDDFFPPGCDIMDLAMEFSELNIDQRAAVTKVFIAKDFSLIQGMPGTGKTSTIAFAARLLAAHGKRVLISSFTHAAVDTVMMKLIEKGMLYTDEDIGSPALIRIGLKSTCHKGVLPCLASNVAMNFDSLDGQSTEYSEPSAESLKKTISAARIVGVTALSAPRSPLLIGQHFDVVIVDEAGQITLPAVLGPLMTADIFALIGDHMQLPPLVVSESAAEGGLGTSLLKALAEQHPNSVAQLTLQYRMHESICQLSSKMAYDGKLRCANNEVAKRKLECHDLCDKNATLAGNGSPPWLRWTIDPNNAVCFLDTDGMNQNSNGAFKSLEETFDKRAGGSIINPTEASIIETTIGELIARGLDPSSIGVICPFRAQLRCFDDSSKVRQWKEQGLEVSTIDRYQGRDKDVIVLSFVRSNEKGKVGRLLSDFRRLNVAFSRAKCKLIMVGSYTTLYKGSDILKPILDFIRDQNWIVKLPEIKSHI